MDMDGMMKRLKEMLGDEENYSSWKQVGVLTTEERIKKREHDRQCGQARRDVMILFKRVEQIKDSIDLTAAEWWSSLYKGHSLPGNGNYHITDDNRILVDPKSLPKKSDN